MDFPFVSEDFQRAFRNTFRAQTNSGRDLHVSDVVIPVVDFTPQASGTSLPSYLQKALSRSTETLSITATTFSQIFSTTGFYQIQVSASVKGGDITSAISSYNGSTYVGLKAYLLKNGTNSSDSLLDTVVVYNPPNHQIFQDTTISGTGEIRFYYTQIADVNGNLTNPLGYSPQ